MGNTLKNAGGRPTIVPGKPRVRFTTFTAADTMEALVREARLDDRPIGYVIDKWFRERTSEKPFAPTGPEKIREKIRNRFAETRVIRDSQEVVADSQVVLDPNDPDSFA